MADGTTKAIETIQRGDKVRAVFHEQPEGVIADGEVVEVLRHEPRNLVEVHVESQVIRVTPKHPFYVRGHGWTAAAELRAGDEAADIGRWLGCSQIVGRERACRACLQLYGCGTPYVFRAKRPAVCRGPGS